MSTSLFLGRIHCLHQALPLNRSTLFAVSNTPTQASPPDPHFAVEYLVQSCGLSFDEARRTSERIQHLKSPDKPGAVLQFLREIGINKSDIKAAVLQDTHMWEKNLRPNIAQLQQFGFSIEDISGMISSCPRSSGALGSAEHVLVVLKSQPGLLKNSFEKVIMSNISFLQDECGLSVRQIVQLMKCSKLITHRPEVLKMKAEKADELGVARSSGAFVYALTIVTYLSQCKIDARLNNLRLLGLSQEEVALMISKAPLLLKTPEEVVDTRMKFLIEKAGCTKIDVVRSPYLLMYSLENRLIPRNFVRKLLTSKGLLRGHRAFVTYMTQTEKQFVEKFIRPYEHVVGNLLIAFNISYLRKSKEVLFN